MSTLLSYKEDSLRKLKETMRKSQQEGEKSCEFAVSEELVWQPGRGGGGSRVTLLCPIQSRRVKTFAPS